MYGSEVAAVGATPSLTTTGLVFVFQAILSKKPMNGRVSNRQKHNGMSWSADGSTSLATLTCVRRNDEHIHWLGHRDIHFTFPGHKQVKPAA